MYIFYIISYNYVYMEREKVNATFSLEVQIVQLISFIEN